MKKIIFYAFVLFATSRMFAQNSPLISVQGTFQDQNFQPVSDGEQTVTFRFYNVAEGGSALWEESADLYVEGGIYSHNLGAIETIDPSIFNESLYLGVEINGYELTPRALMTYSPYSLFVEYSAEAERADNGVPAGAVMPYAGSIDGVPDGYLPCHGQSLLKDDYPDLFAAIGNIYGGTDAGATFNLPDYRGEFLRGLDNGRGIDTDRVLGSAQDDATARPNTNFTVSGNTNNGGAHTHGVTSATAPNWFGTSGNPDWPKAWGGEGTERYHGQTGSSGNHSHSVNLSVNGGGDAETRPRNVAVNFIIKT